MGCATSREFDRVTTAEALTMRKAYGLKVYVVRSCSSASDTFLQFLINLNTVRLAFYLFSAPTARVDVQRDLDKPLSFALCVIIWCMW